MERFPQVGSALDRRPPLRSDLARGAMRTHFLPASWTRFTKLKILKVFQHLMFDSLILKSGFNQIHVKQLINTNYAYFLFLEKFNNLSLVKINTYVSKLSILPIYKARLLCDKIVWATFKKGKYSFGLLHRT